MKAVENAPPMTVTLHMTLRPVQSAEDAAARIKAAVEIVNAMDASWLKLSADGLPQEYADIFNRCVAEARANKPFRDFKIVDQ